MATVSLLARAALRTRVRKSATGSVMAMPRSLLPARLGHPGDEALVGQLAEADPAHAELAEHRARAPTPAAPGVVARLVLLRAAGPHPLRGLRHLALFRLFRFAFLALFRLGRLGISVRVLLLELLERGLLGLGPGARLLLAPLLLGLVGLDRRRAGAAILRERHAERLEQGERLLVGARGRRDGDVEPAHLVDRVVVDLGKDDLLADAHRVVAAAVERARVEAAEVADPRDRDRQQPVEELVHPGVAQGDGDADGHVLAQLERGDRLARAADVRALPRDDGELLGGRLEHVGVLLGVADAHVERDLHEPRGLHRARVAEALHQARTDLALVHRLEPGADLRLGDRHHSKASPLRLLNRTRRPPSSVVVPTRVGSPLLGSSGMTFERWIGPSFSIT